MANTRIKDIATLATSPANDDYIAIDGATNGTRRISALSVGGGMNDYTSTLTLSIDSRGVSSYGIKISVTNIEDITMPNVMQTYAYINYSSTIKYPLIMTHISVYAGSNYYYVGFKSLYGNPQNTTSTTVSGTLHIVTPFEVSDVAVSM